MSAKFLHVFTEENPELQRQIGCMTGIFQMFDRQQILTARRITNHSHKRRHSSGHALSTHASLREEHGAGSPRIVPEKNPHKSLNENQRNSMESSRTSVSSSSCSSFSSLEYSKSTQQEALPCDRTTIPDKSSRNSPKLKTSNSDGRPPRYEHRAEVPNVPAQTARRSLDFRDVVKESINRDSQGLSVKTSPKQGVKSHVLKHRDSPRPMQLSKSIDGIPREPNHFDESLRALVKLKEASWNISEFGESPRTSFEAKAGLFHPESKEAHRFSYERRDFSRQSLDSREYGKLPSKVQELPRLSLDSREDSMRISNLELKPYSNMKKLDRSNSCHGVSNLEQELVSYKRSTNVVAKLMGLEAMPSFSVVTNDPSSDQKQKPSNSSYDNKEDRLSCSPKRSLKNSITAGKKDPDSVMKHIPNPKIPIEAAPWNQQGKHCVTQKATFVTRDTLMQQQQPESVYSEIERRLKELEFQNSNKDLRALKQILDAMQEKGLLDSKNSDQELGDNQSLRAAGEQNETIVTLLPKPMKGRTPESFESPIVIMKPASSIKRSCIPPSSVIPLETLSGFPKLQTHATKASAKHRMVKDQTDQTSNFTSKRVSDKKTGTRVEDSGLHKVRSKPAQVSSRPQHLLRDDGGSSSKTSGSLSPRLQQKRLEAERSRPPPPLPSSESNKPRRSSSNRKQQEPVSPRTKLRQKPALVQDEQLSESNETRNLSHQGDEISQRSDSNVSLSSQVDVEVTSADRSADNSIFQQGSRSPSGRAARKAASVRKQKKPLKDLSEKISRSESVTTAPEQPSPLSVLDASFCQDDSPRSPLKKSSTRPKDDKNQLSEVLCTPSRILDAATKTSNSEINKKKLRSIENLVQKLSKLSSTDGELSTTDHIASLCETKNPDHRYVSEILLASGLLLKDLSDGPKAPRPLQLHPSGHPINPELFLVLEQTKTSGLRLKSTTNDCEQLHRKLVFDIVNEVLIKKLELSSSSMVWPIKLGRRFPSGQKLLKELCAEIEQLQAQNVPSTTGEDCEEVEIKISADEVIHKSEGWADFGKEVPGIVLEIERLVFKDMINEIVTGEFASIADGKLSSTRRQLFPK